MGQLPLKQKPNQRFQKQRKETTEGNVTRQTALRAQFPALIFARLHTKNLDGLLQYLIFSRTW